MPSAIPGLFHRETHAPWDGQERRAQRRLELGTVAVRAAAWDRQVAGFADLVQEQLVAYAEASWPGAAPEARLFTLDGEVVGGALTVVQKLPLGAGAVAVCKWGPMLRDAARPDAAAVYAAMIDRLVAEYARERHLMLTVMPRAATGPENSQQAHLAMRRFRPGKPMLFPDRYLVDLRLDDAAQRKSLHQKWRYHLNKADRAGLDIERAGAERLDEFDALYRSMLDRKQFADHSAYASVPALFATDVPALRPELFFVRHDGEIVAGAIVTKAGDTAVYLFGATNERALPLRAGYFLHWHIIRWLRDHTTARWYDLGGTDGFQGLHQFKKGMVGDGGVIAPIPAPMHYAAEVVPRLLGEGAYAARDLVALLRRRLEGKAFGAEKPVTEAA